MLLEYRSLVRMQRLARQPVRIVVVYLAHVVDGLHVAQMVFKLWKGFVLHHAWRRLVA